MSFQRKQHPHALKLLSQHANEKPECTLLNHEAVIWKWSDGTAVLKSFCAAIAYYDSALNEVFTIKRYFPCDKPYIKQFTDLMVKK